MIQTLEQKAEGHLSNIVSIVSSKATQVMSLLYWKKKKLLINQEVSPLPEDNIRLLCPTFCVSQNFPWISCDELSLTKEKLPKVTHS